MADKPAHPSRQKRLVCIVEGQGEVIAVPGLCSRIRDYLRAYSWFVDSNPIRIPRGQLVRSDNETGDPVPTEGIRRAVTLATRRPADAVLLLCDADDDCAARWGPAATRVIRGTLSGAAVMAAREYEAWLLCSMLNAASIGSTDISDIRGAKERLARLYKGYKPTLHQYKLTQKLNLESMRHLSQSFEKLVRSLAALFEVPLPPKALVI